MKNIGPSPIGILKGTTSDSLVVVNANGGRQKKVQELKQQNDALGDELASLKGVTAEDVLIMTGSDNSDLCKNES